MDYICKKYPDLVPLYDAIYNKETEATSVVWRIKRNGWRKKTAVPSWTTSCPTAGQSLGTRSLWITFTMRKCVARKTPGDATPKNNL